MSTMPTVISSANGPVAYWGLAIPTTHPGGLRAKVRMDLRDGGLLVTLVDRDGTWRKLFDCAEDFSAWLDGIAAGPVLLVDIQKRASMEVAA